MAAKFAQQQRKSSSRFSIILVMRAGIPQIGMYHAFTRVFRLSSIYGCAHAAAVMFALSRNANNYFAMRGGQAKMSIFRQLQTVTIY